MSTFGSKSLSKIDINQGLRSFLLLLLSLQQKNINSDRNRKSDFFMMLNITISGSPSHVLHGYFLLKNLKISILRVATTY